MPTFKKSKSPARFVFASGDSVEKLFAKDIVLVESPPAASTLRLNMSHYAKRRGSSPEDAEFIALEAGKASVAKLTLPDSTVVKKLGQLANIGTVEIDLGAGTSVSYPVKKQEVGSDGVSLEF